MCEELIKELKGVAVETGSLACLGCEQEHGCGIHGCAILRRAADALEAMSAQLATKDARIAELEAEVQALRANSMIQEQIIKDGGNPFDKDKIVRLIMEKTALQSHDNEAMELLEAAIKDLHHGCHTCKTANEATKSVTCKCVLSHNWTWQHADRYETLKA